jgi:hypothetical protein
MAKVTEPEFVFFLMTLENSVASFVNVSFVSRGVNIDNN